MRGILTYWPPIIKQIKEFQEIANTTDPENGILYTELENIYADQYIETATFQSLF